MNRYIFLFFIFSLLVNQFSCQNGCGTITPTVVTDCTVNSVAGSSYSCCMVKVTASGNVATSCISISSNLVSNTTAINSFINSLTKNTPGASATINCKSSYQITVFFTMIILIIFSY